MPSWLSLTTNSPKKSNPLPVETAEKITLSPESRAAMLSYRLAGVRGSIRHCLSILFADWGSNKERYLEDFHRLQDLHEEERKLCFELQGLAGPLDAETLEVLTPLVPFDRTATKVLNAHNAELHKGLQELPRHTQFAWKVQSMETNEWVFRREKTHGPQAVDDFVSISESNRTAVMQTLAADHRVSWQKGPHDLAQLDVMVPLADVIKVVFGTYSAASK